MSEDPLSSRRQRLQEEKERELERFRSLSEKVSEQTEATNELISIISTLSDSVSGFDLDPVLRLAILRLDAAGFTADVDSKGGVSLRYPGLYLNAFVSGHIRLSLSDRYDSDVSFLSVYDHRSDASGLDELKTENLSLRNKVATLELELGTRTESVADAANLEHQVAYLQQEVDRLRSLGGDIDVVSEIQPDDADGFEPDYEPVGLYDFDGENLKVALSDLEDLALMSQPLVVPVLEMPLGTSFSADLARSDRFSAARVKWEVPAGFPMVGIPAASLLKKEATDPKYQVGADGERRLAQLLHGAQVDDSRPEGALCTQSLLTTVRSYWSMRQPLGGDGFDADVDCVFDFGDRLLLVDVKNYGSGRGVFHPQVDGELLLLSDDTGPEGELIDSWVMSHNMIFALDRYTEHFQDKRVEGVVVMVSLTDEVSLVQPDSLWENDRRLPIMNSDQFIDKLKSVGGAQGYLPVAMDSRLQDLVVGTLE